MQPDADRLLATVHLLKDYLERNRALSEASELGVTSAFWRLMLDSRSNFPHLNALLVFRRGDYSYGIGEERQGSEAAERSHFERMAYLMRHSVPDEFVRALAEPAFAAPYVFDYQGCARSASFVVNAATTWHVREQVRAAGLAERPLEVCEIGPGWGACAYQLHAVLPIRSYTFVDLPENLVLSSAYLANTLPERSLETIDVAGGPLGEAPEHTLRAALPRAIERLRCSYDLVLNSFSLQEMEAPTVHGYLEWIAQHLAPGGIFVSINSHGKAGMKQPSDYGFERFEIRYLSRFREYPTGFFNTIPYALTLSARTARSPVQVAGNLDALGVLMQLGLGPEIQGVADAFASGGPEPRDQAWLVACLRWLRSPREARAARLLDEVRTDGPPGLADYLEGHACLARGQLREAAARLRRSAPYLRGFALLRAAVISRSAGGGWEAAIPLDIARAYPEADALLRDGDVAAFVRHFDTVVAPCHT
jgi:hypothetical protein